ncbi:MAG: hypothetical protein AAF750_08245 [Planctomycetota bacterium]
MFPRWGEGRTAVPVWCVTPGLDRTLHRFFMTSPFSPSGRYLAALRMPYEDRRVAPGDVAEVWVVDLSLGEERRVAETRGWEMQMGANIHWGVDDSELIFNDVEEGEWEPFARVVDPATGAGRRLEGTVYTASPDGRYVASADMRAMRRTQAGYGVVLPDELVPVRPGLSDDDGCWVTDVQTGKRELVASIRRLVEQSQNGFDLDDPEQYDVYGFHACWSPTGDRLMFTLRWTAREDRGFADEHQMQRFHSVLTLKPDGTDIYEAIPNTRWVHGGHHTYWAPDGQHLTANLHFPGVDGLRLIRVRYDGTGFERLSETVPGSGHPSMLPGGRYMITDTYTHEKDFGDDDMSLIRWIDLEQQTESLLLEFRTRQPLDRAEARVDPHVAWDRGWRYVAFNGFMDGTRRVYVADLKSVLPGVS